MPQRVQRMRERLKMWAYPWQMQQEMWVKQILLVILPCWSRFNHCECCKMRSRQPLRRWSSKRSSSLPPMHAKDLHNRSTWMPLWQRLFKGSEKMHEAREVQLRSQVSFRGGKGIREGKLMVQMCRRKLLLMIIPSIISNKISHHIYIINFNQNLNFCYRLDSRKIYYYSEVLVFQYNSIKDISYGQKFWPFFDLSSRLNSYLFNWEH